jgi:hypothetical protein
MFNTIIYNHIIKSYIFIQKHQTKPTLLCIAHQESPTYPD